MSSLGPVSPERYTYAVTVTALQIKVFRSEMDAAKGAHHG